MGQKKKEKLFETLYLNAPLAGQRTMQFHVEIDWRICILMGLPLLLHFSSEFFHRPVCVWWTVS